MILTPPMSAISWLWFISGWAACLIYQVVVRAITKIATFKRTHEASLEMVMWNRLQRERGGCTCGSCLTERVKDEEGTI